MVDAVGTIGRAMTDGRFLDKVSHRLAQRGRDGFNAQADIASMSYPRGFHHVYEWNQIGSPAGRLFFLEVDSPKAGGTNIQVNFRPSLTPVPKREMVGQTIPVITRRKDGTTFTQQLTVQPQVKEHIFQWKAVVMESGMRVQIESSEANMLFWVDTQREIGYMTRATEVNYSKQETAGQFTALWNVFWTTAVIPLVIKPRIEQAEKRLSTDATREIVRLARKKSHMPMSSGVSRMEGLNVTFTKSGKPFAGRFHSIYNKKTANTIQRGILEAMK